MAVLGHLWATCQHPPDTLRGYGLQCADVQRAQVGVDSVKHSAVQGFPRTIQITCDDFFALEKMKENSQSDAEALFYCIVLYKAI